MFCAPAPVRVRKRRKTFPLRATCQPRALVPAGVYSGEMGNRQKGLKPIKLSDFITAKSRGFLTCPNHSLWIYSFLTRAEELFVTHASSQTRVYEATISHVIDTHALTFIRQDPAITTRRLSQGGSTWKKEKRRENTNSHEKRLKTPLQVNVMLAMQVKVMGVLYMT